jgi:3-dehydroquinate dehydratase-2
MAPKPFVHGQFVGLSAEYPRFFLLFREIRNMASSMAKILVLNGPNLNLLGVREPAIYGAQTLADIEQGLVSKAAGLNLVFFQSNAEHELIDRIHAAFRDAVDFILINPGAYTHTSVALRDALLAVRIPFIEVHLSNVYAREPFRKHSYLSDIAKGVICGFGPLGYQLALQAAVHILEKGQ